VTHKRIHLVLRATEKQKTNGAGRDHYKQANPTGFEGPSQLLNQIRLWVGEKIVSNE